MLNPGLEFLWCAGEGVYNMVVEVPRWSNAKIEIDLKSPLNPLKQDVKKGKLRWRGTGLNITEIYKLLTDLWQTASRTTAISGTTELSRKLGRWVRTGTGTGAIISWCFQDPNHTDDSTNCKGDNDPIDVCEIGHRIHPRGSVVQVKVLGVFAMIDEGETDWKVIAIDVNDPLAENLNDINDVDRIMPGFLKVCKYWIQSCRIINNLPSGNSWVV